MCPERTFQTQISADLAAIMKADDSSRRVAKVQGAGVLIKEEVFSVTKTSHPYRPYRTQANWSE